MQSDPLHTFLESAAGQKLLDGCARKLAAWMRNNGFSGSLSGCDSLEDIAGELVVMILERDGLRRELTEAAANNNFSGLHALIVESFKRRALDRRRSGRGDAWHAMYRKIVRLLGQRSEFVLHGSRDGSWYAPTRADISGPPELITLPVSRDFTHLPHPIWDHQTRLEPNIEQAAVQFWRLATETSGRIGFVAIRDLVAWLEAKAVVDLRPRAMVTESDLAQDGTGCVEDLAAVPASPPLETEVLARLARRIVATWKPEMARAFHLVHGQGLKQAEAAKAMGYASAAGVNYPLRQAVLNLREMVAAWPELFEDGDERAQEVFLECILAQCRSPHARP
ncbi:MAG: hypothetical protein EA399_02010 [Desulfovibrionales bacterium]|nr:MAG: hypothetical protein EA399_02010 [Desulfovibrionales bacterium]